MTAGQFRGKQLFAGRLFAGRLFGPPHRVFSVGGGVRRVRVPRELIDAQALREIDEDDTLMLLAASLAWQSRRLQ